MTQAYLPKLDRVQNEAMRVTLGTTKDTPIETMQTRQKVKQVKAYFSVVENPHNPLHEAVEDTKGCRLARGKSWRGQTEDSILQVCQLSELKQTKEQERDPNRFRRLYETLLPEDLGKHCREWPASKTVRDQASHSRNQQTARPQSPKTSQGGASLSSKGRLLSVKTAAYTVSASSLTMEVEAVTHALRWIASRGDSRTTSCHHPHRLNELATKSEMENGKPRLECVSGRQSPSKAPVDMLE